jgi:type IV pilus assembly protein PilM
VSDEKSIWKKEISFGRKRKEPAAEPEAQDSDAPAPDESTSLWKKEISFGRKKKQQPAVEVDPVADTSPPDVSLGSDPEPGPEETPAEEPAWTRAVSFGRKGEVADATPSEPLEEPPAADDPEPVSEEAHPALELVSDSDDGVPSGPVAVPDPETGPDETWTRAVSFGRKSDDAPVADTDQPALELVSEPDDGVPSGPVAVPDPETGAEETWTRAVSFGRKSDETPVVDEPGSEEEQPAAEVPVPDPETGAEETWTRAVSFGRKSDEAPVADEPAPEQQEEQPAAEEAPAEPVWTAEVAPPVTPVPEAAAAVEPEPEPGPEPDAPTETFSAVPAPAPGVHPPVTADELPPLEADAQKNVPFWKRDISLGGGKKKEKTPKAERAPKEKKAKKEKQPKQQRERKQKLPKQPKQPKEPKVKAPRGSKGAKRLVGLKVGASQIAAARVANNGSAELLQLAREPLGPGIVVGGELRDPDALAEALKEFFAKHKLPKKGVRLGIANNRIGVRTFDISGIDDPKQLTNAVRFRAQEALPIPIDEAVLDYQVLGEHTGEDGLPAKRILLVVAYRELIDRYVDACRKAGITLTGIDLEAFALLRALQAPQDGADSDPGAALVAVAIGHDRSTFAVSDGRICEFTRVLEWGGSALSVAIARALDAAPSEVDSVKRAMTLIEETVPEGLTAEQAKKARDAMRRAIQTFARELVSSLQYYQNQPGSLGIGEIVLTGGTAHLQGLADELEQLIGVRVRVGDPLARMKVSKKIGEEHQLGSLAVAIGLGIED